MILGLVIVHVWAFHTTGNNNPTGVEVRRTSRKEADADTLPFWPYFVIKDVFALAVVLVGLLHRLWVSSPIMLGHPDNYIEANALATPAHIVPEWYFLPFYAILRAFTGDVWVVMFASWIDRRHHRLRSSLGCWPCSAPSLVMALAPWLDTSERALGPLPAACSNGWFWVFVVNFVVLTYAGGQPAEGIWPTISLIGSAYWFGYFLDHPTASGCDRETATRAPETIEDDFKAHYGKASGDADAAAVPAPRRRLNEDEKDDQDTASLLQPCRSLLIAPAGAALAAGGSGVCGEITASPSMDVFRNL